MTFLDEGVVLMTPEYGLVSMATTYKIGYFDIKFISVISFLICKLLRAEQSVKSIIYMW